MRTFISSGEVILSSPSCRIGESGVDTAMRLESGEAVSIPGFSNLPLPPFDLLGRVESWRLGGWGLKNPTWNPSSNLFHPIWTEKYPDAARFKDFLGEFQNAAEREIISLVPQWQGKLIPDRVCWRPWEMATRRIRWTARDDLFHVDHFSKRPSNGRRLIRFFMNCGQTDPIVWAETDPLAQLIEQGRKYGLPEVFRNLEMLRKQSLRKNSWWIEHLTTSLHDTVLNSVHHGLKHDEEFQESARRRLTNYAPGSSWIAMTDACCHSILRGKWLVDATWFLPLDACLSPEMAPGNLLGTIATAKENSAAEQIGKAA